MPDNYDPRATPPEPPRRPGRAAGRRARIGYLAARRGRSPFLRRLRSGATSFTRSAKHSPRLTAGRDYWPITDAFPLEGRSGGENRPAQAAGRRPAG